MCINKKAEGREEGGRKGRMEGRKKGRKRRKERREGGRKPKNWAVAENLTRKPGSNPQQCKST